MSTAIDDMLSSDEEEVMEQEEREEEEQSTSKQTKKTNKGAVQRLAGADEDDEDDSDEDEEEEGEGEEDGSDEEESDEEEDEEEEEGTELKGMDARKCGPVKIVTSESAKWSDLGISSWLLDQLKNMQLTKPTPVQAACVPKVMSGSDVLGCAKTGTGKTLAFALPILNQLAVDPYGIYALVLTPTRELAFQIGDQFTALGKPIGLKTSVIVGGRDMMLQATELSRRPHVVIATPGRLADHIESDPDGAGKLFGKIAYFVLDEADRMLDGQYGQQLRTIFGAIAKKRQTLLFSATITSAINQLHQVSVRKPFFFEDTSDDKVITAEKLEQKYVLCPVAVKDAYLVYVVKNFCERNPDSQVIIFAHTCRECQALAYMFNALGFKVGSLHSQISQGDRMSALTRFRSLRLKVLICTDVASRGLDIPNVDLVVNHNIPQCPKTYVHRVGRSARAGRFGSSLAFVTQYDVVLLQAVEKLIGKKLDELKVNDKKVSQYVTQVLVSKREAELRLEQQGFGEKREIHKRKELLMAGMDEDAVDKYMDELRERRVNGGKRRADSLGKQVEKRKKIDERFQQKKAGGGGGEGKGKKKEQKA